MIGFNIVFLVNFFLDHHELLVFVNNVFGTWYLENGSCMIITFSLLQYVIYTICGIYNYVVYSGKLVYTFQQHFIINIVDCK